MPGPGGGSHGGGFGGGSHGGSFGGGFGGGPRRGGFGPRRSYYGVGWFHRPYAYYGGGCLGGFLSMMLLPMFLLLFVVLMAFSVFSTGFGALANGGYVYYDEEQFQDYANDRYYEIFDPASESFEDHILITFATNEDCDGYYCIAWVGDNIRYDVSDLFGDESTEFGRAVLRSVNDTNYKYSLDTNLASAIERMITPVLRAADGQSPFRTPHSSYVEAGAASVVNDTDLPVTEQTVTDSINLFTAETGIQIALVIDTEENIFGKTIPVFPIILMIVLTVVAVVFIVRAVLASRYNVKNKKKNPDNDRDFNTDRW